MRKFWQGPDTLSFCANVSPEAPRILGYRGVMTETFARDVNQTPTACVSLCCKNAYRKQSCIYQSSVCSHLKTVVHLSLSRSARLFKLWLDTWWMCIIFLICVSKAVMCAFSVSSWPVSTRNSYVRLNLLFTRAFTFHGIIVLLMKMIALLKSW